jgi:tripartite-type tricarboxylate transporter receptor subunit TctC
MRAHGARFVLLTFLASANVAAPAHPQTFPSHPVTIVVPFPAGGPTDTVARIMADRMRVSLGKPVIVENVSGAGGSIGVARVARAAPDGYTLSLGQLLSHVFTGAVYKVQYDLMDDFEPVSLLTSGPLMLIGRRDLPAKNLGELIAWLKADQSSASLGVIGIGSPTHVWAIGFQSRFGIHFQFVPYRGAAPIMQDLLAAQVDLTCLAASDSLPQVRSGNSKAYAVLSKAPWAAAPDIPTIGAAGVPGLEMPLWNALWAPKGTPKDIVDKLDQAVVETLADPAVRRRFTDVGEEIFPRDDQRPEALRAYQKAEIEKWWPIIKAANLKAQ